MPKRQVAEEGGCESFASKCAEVEKWTAATMMYCFINTNGFLSWMLLYWFLFWLLIDVMMLHVFSFQLFYMFVSLVILAAVHFLQFYHLYHIVSLKYLHCDNWSILIRFYHFHLIFLFSIFFLCIFSFFFLASVGL